MQGLCVSDSTTPAKGQAQARSVPGFLCCLHCRPCWNAGTVLGSALQLSGRLSKGQIPISQRLPARAQLRSAQSPAGHSCQGCKPHRGWTVTVQEIKHSLKGWNYVVQDGESWFSLKVGKFWRVPFFQSTINCFLTVTVRSFPLVSIIFPFPRKVTNLIRSGIFILLLVSFKKKNKETYYHHSLKSLSSMGFGFVELLFSFGLVWFGGAFCCQANRRASINLGRNKQKPTTPTPTNPWTSKMFWRENHEKS